MIGTLRLRVTALFRSSALIFENASSVGRKSGE
jgi:hypothetical protein